MAAKSDIPRRFAVPIGQVKYKRAQLRNFTLNMQSDDQKVAYSIGLSIGANFQNQGLDLDPAYVNQGIVDALSGNDPKLSEAEMQEVMMRFQQAQMEKMQAKQGEEASQNAEASAAFLAENATKEGVVTTESGLQYKVITQGTGATPGARPFASSMRRSPKRS